MRSRLWFRTTTPGSPVLPRSFHIDQAAKSSPRLRPQSQDQRKEYLKAPQVNPESMPMIFFGYAQKHLARQFV
jgi:hypothetical protein